MTNRVPMYLEDQFYQSEAKEWIEVTNPATNDVIAEVPCSTESEIDRAIHCAKQTFATWKNVPVPERARLMLRYQHLLKENHDHIAEVLSFETGKTCRRKRGCVARD